MLWTLFCQVKEDANKSFLNESSRILCLFIWNEDGSWKLQRFIFKLEFLYCSDSLSSFKFKLKLHNNSCLQQQWLIIHWCNKPRTTPGCFSHCLVWSILHWHVGTDVPHTTSYQGAVTNWHAIKQKNCNLLPLFLYAFIYLGPSVFG